MYNEFYSNPIEEMAKVKVRGRPLTDILKILKEQDEIIDFYKKEMSKLGIPFKEIKATRKENLWDFFHS